MTKIGTAFDQQHGFVPPVMVLTAAELDQAVALNPSALESGLSKAALPLWM
ncbi:MAG: hypothetical protein ACI9WU_001134 [Myxococcota bacterium]